jgi:hypothetical protein
MVDYSDDDSKKSMQSSGTGVSLIMFILNVIIIQNTTRSGFEQVMPYGDEYYSYNNLKTPISSNFVKKP